MTYRRFGFYAEQSQEHLISVRDGHIAVINLKHAPKLLTRFGAMYVKILLLVTA